MKKCTKIQFAGAILFTLLFAAFTVLVKVIDVAAIGPEGAEVGFATINKAFHDWTGVSEFLHGISEITGVVALATVGVFALIGLIEWISRKNMFKVDSSILVLGGLYLIVGAIYLIFTKVVVNYRPILEDGALESSYPSSHTVLAIIVYFTAIVEFNELLAGSKIRILAWIGMGALLILTLVGRTFSGYHWLTDIIGGVILSIALVLWFLAVRGFVHEKEKEKEDELRQDS